MKKNKIAFLLSAAMLLQLVSCAPVSDPVSPEIRSDLPEITGPAEAEKTADGDVLPAIGEELSGFIFQGADPYEPLDAEILYFTHEQSGAKLCYIKNDDTNRAFTVAYRTPHVDETDANHIFEHAILASSSKYPSRDLFFDLAGKTYSTYVNAYTYLPFTLYPVGSRSEKQLLLMADAYLSCMADPDLLRNEYIFQREAVRCMLYDVDDPITMGGTVFSEDTGNMTDMDGAALRNLLRGLYPGEYASNFIGLAHINYRDLTFEHVAETYERCYGFDNSLMLLYGDLDYRSFLKFIHEEYLSKAERPGTDLSVYDDPKTEPGYVEETAYAPAYEGDSTENASRIYYAMDLDGQDWETLLQYEYLSRMLDSEGSLFYENLRDAGLVTESFAEVILETEKPIFLFGLKDAEPEDAPRFKKTVDDTLAEAAEQGLDSALVETVLQTEALRHYTMREDTDIAIEYLFPRICFKWAQTGEADILAEEEAAFSAMRQDTEQALVRTLAASLQNAARSAMITTVPQPGLAEQILAEQEAYLAERKASMTSGELEQMVKDTLDFDAWNASEQSNSDVGIRTAELPELEDAAEFAKEEVDGAVYYTAASEMEQISLHQIYFDTSAVSQEDLHYIALYSILLLELAAGNYTKAEKDHLMARYLYDLKVDTVYPKAGEHQYPMLRIDWYCMAGDYETSLRLLLDIMGELKLDDKDEMIRVLDKYLPSLDGSGQDPFALSERIASAGMDLDNRYREYLNGQRFYEFAEKLRRQLDADQDAMGGIAEKLRSIQRLILHRDRMAVLNIAPQGEAEQISDISRQVLGALPSLPLAEADYDLPEYPDRTAVIVEASNYYTFTVSDTGLPDDLSGSFFPFVIALSDRYIVPKVRFQGLAYSAEMGFYRDLRAVYTYTYSDPGVANTVAVIDGEADALAAMELTQEELDEYILYAYSTATLPAGSMTRYLDAMYDDLVGADAKRRYRLVGEIKNAAAEDKERAVEVLRELLEHQHLVTAGNARLIREEADTFDQVYDYREPLD